MLITTTCHTLNPRCAGKEKLRRGKQQQQQQNTFSRASRDEVRIWCNGYSPPPSQPITASGRESEGESERGDLMQIHITPPAQPNPGPPHNYSRFMISNGLGSGLLFCLTFPPLQTPIFPFFHLICAKINSRK